MAAGVNVFVLFDTSNRMYKAFPYVYDSISELVRRLGSEDSVAIYTFSRNLFRAAPLTRDHDLARAGLNNAVAGDDTALFNALLLTLRDAAPVSGRRAIVAFSNGPDTASTVSPYDVAAVAENEGVPIHIISSHTPEQDQGLAEALRFLTERSGGNLYYARTRDQQSQAFRSAREDIESSYTACYYPAPNPNSGFRALRVEIQTPASKAYQVRTRSGYRIRDRERVSGKSLNPKK
jgi:VWFA-related protein